MSAQGYRHAERNALNAPEDTFNDGYKLSTFPTSERHGHLLWAQKPPVTTPEVFAE